MSSKRRLAHALVRVLSILALVLFADAGAVRAHDEPNGRPHHKGIPANPTAVMRAFMKDVQPSQSQLAVETDIPCTDGFAGSYPCHGIDLLAFMPLAEIGGNHQGSAGNDSWGWTDPETGREYALVGRVYGTSFVDITVPTSPVYLGELFTHLSAGSSWRDIKVYQDHAFIVSEAGGHGMQVFDLTQLRGLDPAGAPYSFTETAHYGGFGSAHNLVINEATGYAYGVGVNATLPNTCEDGLHIVDISTPTAPVFVGCYDGDGYTHDAQCVLYAGPDSLYQGREICFASNEDTLTIVDVDDKANPQLISRTGYAGFGYTHQGWLSEDHAAFFLDDELDERNFGHGTRTRTWDVSNLDAPQLIDTFTNVTSAIDHNIYVKDDLLYQANYRAGLSVLEILRDAGGSVSGLGEIAYFDIYPSSNSAFFNGAWSNYPYFASGSIVVSGIEQGLFVLALNLPDEVAFVSPDPDGGSPVSGAAVPIEIMARDGEIAADPPTVEWQVDDDPLQAASYSGAGDLYTATWDTTAVMDGPHSLAAVMTDAGGSETTTTISVEVRNADDPPSVAITNPSDGDTISGNVTLTATASDDGTVIGVAFFDGTTKIGDADFNGSAWTQRFNAKKASEGPHVITGRATDNSGNSAEASVTVMVGGGSGGGGPGGGGGGGPKCNPKKDPTCQR